MIYDVFVKLRISMYMGEIIIWWGENGGRIEKIFDDTQSCIISVLSISHAI